jgi:hypothetical protein
MSRSEAREVDGILLLYHFIPPYAETVLEHAEALERFSRFPVWSLNTSERFPKALHDLRFRVVVLHYSLFGSAPFRLSPAFREYLGANRSSLLIAFFQDEYDHVPERYAFVDEFGVDWIYTLLAPADAELVYGRRTHRPRLFSTIPGFVSDRLHDKARRFARPEPDRPIDVGYRGRRLPFYMGRGAQEKAAIGRQFAAKAQGRELALDIASDEGSRLYGDAWYRFLGSCKAVLGVEAGVSIFDLDGQARIAVEELRSREPDLSFEEVSRRVLSELEDNIPYRTISPRHFEAAAFDTCQILFEGSYSGIMQAGTHYIALQKDFANFDDVMRAFLDRGERARIVANARQDLIESERYSYREFVRGFDDELERAGLMADGDTRAPEVDRALARGAFIRRAEARLRTRFWRWRMSRRRSRAGADVPGHISNGRD